MKCPRCKKAMVVLELRDVEVDHCLCCGGVWLDAGELELLLEGAEAAGVLLASFRLDESGEEKKIKCPLCARKMDKVFCGLKNKVRIDRCRNGDGIWFDRGELTEVLSMGRFEHDQRVLDLLKDVFRSEEAPTAEERPPQAGGKEERE